MSSPETERYHAGVAKYLRHVRKRNRRFRCWHRDRDSRDGVGHCGKVAIVSHKAARSKAKAMMGNGRDPNPAVPMNAYYCHNCDAWHVGHNIKAPARGVRP